MNTHIVKPISSLPLAFATGLAHAEVLDKLPQAADFWLWFGCCGLAVVLWSVCFRRRKLTLLAAVPSALPLLGLADLLHDTDLLRAAWAEAPLAYWLNLALPVLLFLGLLVRQLQKSSDSSR